VLVIALGIFLASVLSQVQAQTRATPDQIHNWSQVTPDSILPVNRQTRRPGVQLGQIRGIPISQWQQALAMPLFTEVRLDFTQGPVPALLVLGTHAEPPPNPPPLWFENPAVIHYDFVTPTAPLVNLTAIALPIAIRGQNLAVGIVLAGATPVSGLEWVLTVPDGWASSTVINSALVTKQLSCGSARCLLYGLGEDAIPPGTVAQITILVPASATPGPLTMALTALASDPTGVLVLVKSTGAMVTVQ
jgi:hypothetical protein